ncbi:glycine N-methyltransferase [Hyalella azteca]|uniref:Glycine N-methyltransferase n=1 Tax=Hyalella azteca TaxID=294128 RepID=A0A8B7MZ52_HYAAZ|nr:glycine N-methyltransferase [Hyalella azteca]XP_018006544.1 glycine N-methyltransferase [Hyalella azteca]
MSDNRIYRTRSLGIPAAGLKDQYSDGTAAHLWELYIGDKSQRTAVYRKFITDQLKARNCITVLDVACGTGIDSVMLLEEGFRLTSVDLSDKMLKYALKTRWKRRKEPAFDAWEIEEANWMTLMEDIDGKEQFDAVICLGNSFAHLPNEECDFANQRLALSNFCAMVKPGGVLLIDHRNYDDILDRGTAPTRNIYYNSEHVESIITSVVVTEGTPVLVTLDYVIKLDGDKDLRDDTDSERAKRGRLQKVTQNKFRLSYFPHRLDSFTSLLRETFGPEAQHSVYGDFQPLGHIARPAFYIHLIEKPAR